ncbi:MAG: outer membrane beta-barrel protein, partial [Coxiellaceae bacterium]|nr:outer membrane beta-barrel protein [Coxiellaceae bacterium]
LTLLPQSAFAAMSDRSPVFGESIYFGAGEAYMGVNNHSTFVDSTFFPYVRTHSHDPFATNVFIGYGYEFSSHIYLGAEALGIFIQDPGFGTGSTPPANTGSRLRARQAYGFDVLYGYVISPCFLAYFRTGMMWAKYTRDNFLSPGGQIQQHGPRSYVAGVPALRIGAGLSWAFAGKWVLSADYAYITTQKFSMTYFSEDNITLAVPETALAHPIYNVVSLSLSYRITI